MANTITKLLIVGSIIIGLMFITSLCFNIGTTYVGQSTADSVEITPDRPTQPNPTPTPPPTPQPAVNSEPATATTNPTPKPTNSSASATATPPPTDSSKPTAASEDNTAENITWNGLQIDITGINYDAWPLIKAQNRNNEPPLEGMDMLLIKTKVTNISGAAEEPVLINASDFQLIGERNILYKQFEVSCGVVPDNLDGVVPLIGSMDGNICFQISSEESGFELIYEPFNTPAIYFDLPQRDDTDWIPPELPPPLLEAKELTRNGLQIDIVNLDYEAWPLIKARNDYNDPPLEGKTMLLITVRTSNVAGNPEEIIRIQKTDFKLIGDRNTVYKTFNVSCGVIPNDMSGVLALGDTMEANVCFQIDKDEADFQLIYEPFKIPAAYFDLPPREAQ